MTEVENILPQDAYLATIYYDWRNKIVTRRVYYNDGRVEAFDGKEWWFVCQFNSAKIEKARTAILQSGLTTAADLSATDIHDAAILRFTWRIGDKEGIVTNWAYPAVDHPVFEKLEEELEKLETG
jgi:hypothetical protein